MILSFILAITLGQVQTQADNRIAVILPAVQNAMATCLASKDGCYTTWSAPTPCNTVTADSTMCTMAQTDPGMPDPCGVATGLQTFASYGITLPATDIFQYRINTYVGPGGRGVQVCVRAQFNGTTYERCIGNGVQAAAFTHPWQAIIP